MTRRCVAAAATIASSCEPGPAFRAVDVTGSGGQSIDYFCRVGPGICDYPVLLGRSVADDRRHSSAIGRPAPPSNERSAASPSNSEDL